MKNFDKYITIKLMSEFLAYEVYYIYKMDKNEIDNIEYIYNSLSSHLIFNQYKNEIIELWKVMAKILYNVPIN